MRQSKGSPGSDHWHSVFIRLPCLDYVFREFISQVSDILRETVVHVTIEVSSPRQVCQGDASDIGRQILTQGLGHTFNIRRLQVYRLKLL